MTTSVANQVQYFKQNIFTRVNNNDISTKSKTSFESQSKIFKKILTDKSEKEKNFKASTVHSKNSKEASKNEPADSKEIDKEQVSDKILDKKEEKRQELNSLIEGLIHTLQTSNIIDMDKLQPIIEDLQNASLNLEELKAILENLELNTNTALSKEINDKLVKVFQLAEAIGELSILENTSPLINSNSNPMNVVENTDKEANINAINNEELNGNGNMNSETNSTDTMKDESNVILNTSEEHNAIVNTDKEEKSQIRNSEAKTFSKNSNKGKDLFKTNNPLNDSSLDQKDFEFVGIKNFEVDGLKDYGIVNANKSLGSVIKADFDIFNQIIEGAKINVSEDVSEMLLKLKPDNLGKLSMKIVIDRGMLVAKFDVESQIVKEAIESNLEDLRNALKDKGFEIQQFDVSVNKDSDHNESQFGYFNRGQRKKMSFNNDLVVMDSYISSQQSIDGLNSTINYLG